MNVTRFRFASDWLKGTFTHCVLDATVNVTQYQHPSVLATPPYWASAPTYRSSVIDGGDISTQWFSAEWSQGSLEMQGFLAEVGNAALLDGNGNVVGLNTGDPSYSASTFQPFSALLPFSEVAMGFVGLDALPRGRYMRWTMEFTPSSATNVSFFQDVKVFSWVPEVDPAIVLKLLAGTHIVLGDQLRRFVGALSAMLADTKAMVDDFYSSFALSFAVDQFLAEYGDALNVVPSTGIPPEVYRVCLLATLKSQFKEGRSVQFIQAMIAEAIGMDPTTVAITAARGFGFSALLPHAPQLAGVTQYPNIPGVTEAQAGVIISECFGCPVTIHGTDAQINTLVDAFPNNCTALAYDRASNLYYVTDEPRGYRYSGSTTQVLDTAAVSGSSGDGGPATAAHVTNVTGIAFDYLGNIFYADSGAFVVRKVTIAGTISTYAGTGSVGIPQPAVAATACFFTGPLTVAVLPNGDLLICDKGSHVVMGVDLATGVMYVYAGQPTIAGFGGDSGPAIGALLSSPSAIATTSDGKTYVADSGNRRVRLVTSGRITTYAGNGGTNATGDGGQAVAAQIGMPGGVAASTASVWEADTAHSFVRVVNGYSGVITDYAGVGIAGFSGDGGSPQAAQLSSPTQISVAPNGDVSFIDSANQRVRRIIYP